MDTVYQSDDVSVGKDFRGRMGRSAFIARFIGFFVSAIVAKEVFVIAVNPVVSAIAFLFFLALTYWMLTFSVKRAHDFGSSGSTGWLMLIPVVNFFWLLVLAFRPGDSDQNLYGPAKSDESVDSARVNSEIDKIDETPASRESMLQDLKTLHEKGLLSADAYKDAQLEILRTTK